MLAAALLKRKRAGEALTDSEIRFLIDGFCRGDVADYQMSALAMAICLQGMNARETTTLTQAMLDSGERLPRPPGDDHPRVDKHSTGGLGDKVSLVLAPLLAACDLHVPMISGRGLGLTGGTLDKLESIEGFRTQLDVEESNEILKQVGAFIMGASERIAPADRRLYALRDVTGTVDSIPLITASILSKKLAANLDTLVMDVKVGSGAFMSSRTKAVQLADSLIRVGGDAGLPTTAVLSDMDQPLGKAIGNALEVNEAVQVLEGGGPPEVRELTIELGANLLLASGDSQTRDQARNRLNDFIDNGAARERFDKMVRAQGGDARFPLTVAPAHDLVAQHEGYVETVDCERIGETIVGMGGGRRKKNDTIDATVGVTVHVRIGDLVEKGQPIITVHPPGHAGDDYLGRLNQVVKLCETPVASRPLILSH